MSSTARHVLHEALLWAAVALGGLALFYFFDDLRGAFGPGGSAPAIAGRTAQSQPPAASPARCGSKPTRAAISCSPPRSTAASADFMADTGATLVVLTYEDAARLGLSPQRLDFIGRAQTANGTARVAPVTLDRVRVEDITIRNVPAVVAEKGALATNLLGMSFLGRLKSFQMQGRELVLVR